MNSQSDNAKTLFLNALEMASTSERQAYLDAACAGDETLRREVEELVRHHLQLGSFLDSAGAAPTASSARQPVSEGPGTVLGPYKLLEQLGEGGMGVVFMAEQMQPFRRTVALKVIKPGMDSRHVLARFEAERQALALMDHANIARVLDAGATASGRPYFVMELVHGVPITKFCDDNRLTPRARLELFVLVCQALQHAHQKGIIHRDVKPSNVLVTLHDGRPVPKVIDFGVAKATEQRLTERTLVTQHGTMLGTPQYMSPEQAELSALGTDTRSDIYSLGVLLYELLTGSTPLSYQRLKVASYGEILRMIQQEESPKPSTRLSDSGEALTSIAAQRQMEPAQLTKLVKGELDWIVMKCLEKDRTRRYETANALARDVERYLSDEAVEACPPSARYRLRKYARKHKRAFLLATAFVALLIGGVVVSTWQAVRATIAERQTNVDRNRAVAAEEEAKANEAKARDEARRAKQAEAEARAVLEFFQQWVLAAARPQGQAGGLGITATIRDAVDAAEPHIGPAFVYLPLAEAWIRSTLGESYRYLGEPALAIRQHERSRQLRVDHLGPDHPDTLTSMNRLALAYEAAGKLDLALPLFEETLAKVKATLGPDHRFTLLSMNNLASGYYAAGKFDQTVPLWEETLAKQKATLGSDHRDTLTSMNNLARAYGAAGKLNLAVSLHEETLAKMKAKLGPDHPDTLACMNGLAATYQDAGKFEKALPLLEAALEKRKATLGPDHLDTLTSMNNLAIAYRDAGRLGEAEPLFREAVTGARAKLGFDHPNTKTYQLNLADCYARLRQPAKAEPHWRELAAYWREKVGADSPQYTGVLHRLGQSLLEQRKHAEAEPLLREGLKIREAKRPDEWMTFNTQSLLGDSLLGQKKYAEAEPLLLAGYSGLKQREAKIPAQGKVRLTEALMRLVQLYEATGDKDKAAEWRKRREPAKDPPKP